MKFPRNKKSIALTVLFLILSLVFIYRLLTRSDLIRANFLENIASEVSEKDLADDPDFDGLKNWEEEIYHTFPNNPDTDGDGYLDGEEVASGYDPTKPAPNDKLPENNSTQDRPEPGNLTQMMGYLVSLHMASSDVPMDANNIQNAINNISEKDLDLLKRASFSFFAEFTPPFVINNEQVFKIQNDESTNKYERGISAIQAKGHGCTGDIEAMEDAIVNQNFAKAKCLSDLYKRDYYDYINLSVPSNLVDPHVRITIAFWKLHKGFESIQQKNDPLKIIFAVEKIEQGIEEIIDALKDMQRIVQK